MKLVYHKLLIMSQNNTGTKTSDEYKKIAIGFAHWKDRHFKRTYPWTGYFYCLEHYESIKLIPGVKYGEHYSFEQLYDMYIESQKTLTPTTN